MSKSIKPTTAKPPRPPKPTRDLLIDAALAEFNEVGFLGTDTNRIARRAGFAPQTFYRHFEDKVAVFVAAYDQWREREMRAVDHAIRSEANVKRRAAAIARTLVAFHRSYAVFRRSLRALAIDDPRVRRARSASRAAQLESLHTMATNLARPRAALLGALLEVERLCDALADGEPTDLLVTDEDFLDTVVAAVRRARNEA